MKVSRRVIAAVVAALVLCHVPVVWCAGTEGAEPVVEPGNESIGLANTAAATVPFFDQTTAFPDDPDENSLAILDGTADGRSRYGLVQFLETMMSLGIVLVAICLIIWLLRKFVGRTPMLLDRRVGHVIGRIYLSAKNVIYLVQLADRVLVIGASAASMTCLAEITDQAVIEQMTAGGGQTFLDVLGRANSAMTAEKEPAETSGTIEEHMEDIESQISRLRALGENEPNTD
jgi:flagellar biogenesis protein FliO